MTVNEVWAPPPAPAGLRRLARRAMRRLTRRFHPVVTIPYPPFRIKVNLRDTHVAPELFVDGVWEPHLLRYLPFFRLEGRVAIDVGAHVGVYTLLLSRLTGAAGGVIAFEPEQENFGYLQENVKTNGVRNATLLQLAAGDRPRTALLKIDTRNRGNHRLVAETAAGSDVQECSVVTVDSVTASIPERSVGFVKIDVQGAELQVLHGMRETLARNPGVILQVELGLDAEVASAIVRQLRSFGFDGWEVSRGGRRPLPPDDPAGDVDLLVAGDVTRLTAALEEAEARFARGT